MQYYIKNCERLLKSVKQYTVNNLEKVKNCKRISMMKKPEKYQEIYRKFYFDNKKELQEYKNQWRRETEKGKLCNQRSVTKRRAKERKIINTLTSKEWLDILKDYDYKCAYCGKEFDENTLPEKDHIIPISKNGDNVKENIVPSCKSCNARKGNKILEEVEYDKY